MMKRLILSLLVASGLAGCAIAPPSFRAVAHPNSGSWLQPPGAGSEAEVDWAGREHARRFYIDVPVPHSTCAYASYPKERPGKVGLQGEFVPTPAGVVLRMRSEGMFVDERSLRTAWANWWDDARKEWPGKCLAADPKVIEEMLVERRPLPFGEMLKLHYGFDNVTRTVVIRPGTSVCAADVSYRGPSAPRFAASGESCATAVSDGHGGANFGPAASVLYKFSLLDVSDRKVHAIASWAEIPELKGHLFLLRYPKGSMPVSPAGVDGAKDTAFPLLIAVDTAADRDVVGRALQCVQGNDLRVGDFCGKEGFGASSCGTVLPAGSKLADSRPICFRFGERGVLTPHITVLLNGAPVAVPLGTTLGGALERLTPPHRDNDQHSSRKAAALSGARVTRVFEGRPVRVDVSGAGASALQLLLLPGDQLSW